MALVSRQAKRAQTAVLITTVSTSATQTHCS